MSNLRQTTLPFATGTGRGQTLGARHSSSPKSASKVSTPKTSSSSHSSKSAPTNDERDHLRQLARSTLVTVEQGGYITPSGGYVSIRPAIDASLKGTLFYFPNAFDKWETVRPYDRGSYSTEFKVKEVTTLQAAQEFAAEAQRFSAQSAWGPPAHVGILNFASGQIVRLPPAPTDIQDSDKARWRL